MATAKNKPTKPAAGAADGERHQAGQTPKKAGRPSTYSEELATTICDRIAGGETMVKICREDGMPNRRTVMRWMDVHAEFAARCVRAREIHADYAHDRMMEIEVGVLEGEIDATAARVVLSSMQWRAAKLAPRKYGDMSKVEHSGPGGGAIPVQATVLDANEMSQEERDALRAVLQAAKARKERA